ncbi:MAG: hypothetical protein KBF21_11185 [Thermoanaerobaculia bacterium]|jgi:hypothetical protein|nr:hypothetical protein [Thermoanaerobaculia bacterium]MBP9824776.1 hypothetical protein [Thermoanaerobaculia bacterium]
MTPSRFVSPPLPVLLLLVAGLSTGCFGGSRPEKARGAALWLARDSGALDAIAQNRLAAAGLGEFYLDAAELEWNGSLKLRRFERPAIPRRTPTTLVVSGPWLPGDRPPDALATALLAELSALRIESEQDGLLVVGFHFEVDPGDSAERLGKTLGRLRSILPDNLFLSAGLDRHSLAGPAAQTLADAVDYVTCMIYGQRPGEAEDPAAWDLEAVEENFRRLEALKRPYFTGAVTLGTATWRGRGGEAKGSSTELSLGELIRARNLELAPGFSLLGIDRQVWEFVARGPVRVGPWSLAAGDRIRVVRTATPFIEEFRRRVVAWESPHRLGDVFYRLRRESEGLSLSVDNFVAVLAPDAAAPELELAIERVATGDRRWVVRVGLTNRSSESSDLAFFDSNFVQLQVSGATIGDANPGDFERLELLVDGEKGTMRAFREANTVRFFLPLVEENQTAASGEIELRLTQREPTLAISATFLLADGRTLTLDPRDWQFEER